MGEDDLDKQQKDKGAARNGNSRLLRSLFYISATLAAFTYVVTNASCFFEQIPRFRRSFSYAIFGPDNRTINVRSGSETVVDGGQGSQWKHKTLCLVPQNGGKLIIGRSHFVPETRSADPARAFWTDNENKDPENSFCVTISTGTDDSKVYTNIGGHIEGLELVQVPYKNEDLPPICK